MLVLHMWIDFKMILQAVLLVLVIIWILSCKKSPGNLPPGPKGLPLVGYLPFLGKNPLTTFTELKKKYGDIFTVYFATDRTIILASYKAIHEALVKQGNNFAERPRNSRDAVTFNSKGLVSSYGASRIEMRHFTLTTLHDFGMGKSALEPQILDEIDCLVNEIKKLEGHPTFLQKIITSSFVNVICAIIIGRRMDYEDEIFQNLSLMVNNLTKSLGINQWAVFLPKFLQKLFRLEASVYAGVKLQTKLLDVVKKHSNCTYSFIDAWKTESEKPNSNPDVFNVNVLSAILTELFIAGSHTTNMTLEWMLLYLIKYPAVQAKVQMEIDNVIGVDRLPSMNDQKLMPYTEAVLMEINRIVSLLVLGFPHMTIKDVNLCGYFIPKNTTIITNLWAVHRDPEVFPDPETFKPERFLTKDNQVKKQKELIPFSLGKRQCPGEELAQMELFLYLTTLLQHFTFTMEGDVILDCKFGFILEPIPQKICVNLR